MNNRDEVRSMLIERFVRKHTASGRTVIGAEWQARFGSTKSTEAVIDAVLEALMPTEEA